MDTISQFNWSYFVRKKDFSFTKPMEDLDSMRIGLRVERLARGEKVMTDMVMPFTDIKINIQEMTGQSPLVPNKVLILEKSLSFGFVVREHSSMKGFDSSPF